MAQAHAELTGELGVALVTAGPGMTNAITGIANAHVSRAPVLVMSGGNGRPQEIGAVCRTWTTPNWCARSRAMPAPCVSRPWSWTSSTRRSRALSAKAASPAPPTSISRPTRCAASSKALQLDEHLDAKPRAVTRPEPAQVPRGRSPVVGAPRAGDFRTRRPRRRPRTDLAARPARRRLSRYGREPGPGAG